MTARRAELHPARSSRRPGIRPRQVKRVHTVRDVFQELPCRFGPFLEELRILAAVARYGVNGNVNGNALQYGRYRVQRECVAPPERRIYFASRFSECALKRRCVRLAFFGESGQQHPHMRVAVKNILCCRVSAHGYATQFLKRYPASFAVTSSTRLSPARTT